MGKTDKLQVHKVSTSTNIYMYIDDLLLCCIILKSTELKGYIGLIGDSDILGVTSPFFPFFSKLLSHPHYKYHLLMTK